MNFPCFFLSLVLFIGTILPSFSQTPYPEFQLEQSEIEGHLRFLASDELAGRRTGEVGNNLAARYIASYFQAYGLQMVPGADGYFQPFALEQTTPPSVASLAWGKSKLELKEDFVVIAGGAISIKKKEAVFVGYGTNEEDYAGKILTDKVLVSLIGMPNGNGVASLIEGRRLKQQFAKNKGALAIIELYNFPMPWNVVARFLGGTTVDMVELGAVQEQELPHIYLNDSDPSYSQQFKPGSKTVKITLDSPGIVVDQSMKTQNVIGWIEGTDPKLKDEYMLLTAHYDHVGTGKNGGQPFTEEDSIFNGARDNGIGTIAMLSAAKSLAAAPPKRSVIVIALTGEEIGLLGSRYYADHPLIPLEKTVMNLNTDNGGYNDTTAVSIMGYHRVGAELEMMKAAATFGFRVIADPAPEQNLFDRSDNVSFAAKGIPAPSFGPGMDKFDKEILQYYHQVSDEVSNINFSYLLRFCQAYAYAARLIADKAERPRWKEGDKYEPAFKELYGDD